MAPTATFIGNLTFISNLTNPDISFIAMYANFSGVLRFIAINATTVVLPTHVFGISIYLVDSPLVTILSLPSLTFIGHKLLIQNNTMLTYVSIPLLTYVGDIFFMSQLPSLVTFATPLVATILGPLNFNYCSMLPSVSLPLLTYVGTYFNIFQSGMNSISMDNLSYIGAGLTVVTNANITSLSFPALTTISNVHRSQFIISVGSNPALTLLSVPSLAHVATTSPVQICNNSAAFTVPPVIPKLVKGFVCFLGNGTNAPACTSAKLC
jgi:hypothetical protein